MLIIVPFFDAIFVVAVYSGTLIIFSVLFLDVDLRVSLITINIHLATRRKFLQCPYTGEIR